MSSKAILGKMLSDLWDKLEVGMGEMAAYNVACEEMNIDPDDGWEYLEAYAHESNKSKEVKQ